MQKLKYISVILGAVAFVACSDDERSPYLNGKDKTPITVTTNLSTGGTVTRAVDATFESGDVLNAYIKHVTVVDASANPLVWASDVTGHGTDNEHVDGIAPRLVGFNVSSSSSTVDNYNTKKLTSTEGLYWDDFSNSKYDDTYLRTEGHALMVYYGYGYNGGTPSSSLTESTGVIGWSVATNQTAAADFKKSDLIYAGSQAPVAYNHSNSSAIGADHGILSIPYSHAMSKVSVVIELSDGYEADDANFAKTVVTLKNVNTKCTVKAPTQTLTEYNAEGSIQNVIMQPLATSEDKLSKSFTALIVPTVMKDGQTLATITDVHGNNYEINLTDAGLTTAVSQSAKPWSSKLAAADATSVAPVASDAKLSDYNENDGGLTIPGVHYKLYVKIKKQQISVTASIRDWDEVEATGTGKIQFENDITDLSGDIAEALRSGGFDLYKMTSTSTIEGLLVNNALSSEDKQQIFKAYDATPTTEDVVDYSSRVTWTPATETVAASWGYDPYTYWQNKDDKSYFRALAPAGSSNTTVENGKDLLWGTTDAHSGKDVNGNSYTYGEGAAIDPRTGKVPLKFYHAMSKITVKLIDANSTGTAAAKLDLNNAVIQFENLATSGTIDLHTGVVSAGEFTAGQNTFSTDFYAESDQTHGCTRDNSITTPHIIKDYIITPQEITDAATIIITLNNGTTYKAQLNKCKVKSSTPANNSNHPVGNSLSRWYSGTSYTYEIYLSKEIVEFRALIKNWDEVTAGGTITPEW